jgi:hypothetical protein
LDVVVEAAAVPGHVVGPGLVDEAADGGDVAVLLRFDYIGSAEVPHRQAGPEARIAVGVMADAVVAHGDWSETLRQRQVTTAR